MKIKILKYTLFTFFSLALINILLFYYSHSIPDNYLTISSTTSYGFFSYLFFSGISFISYYSGLWTAAAFFLFLLICSFRLFARADFIDLFAFVPLSFLLIISSYWIHFNLLGGGANYIVSEIPFWGIFITFLTSGIAIFWILFRKDFFLIFSLPYRQIFNFKKLSSSSEQSEEKLNINAEPVTSSVDKPSTIDNSIHALSFAGGSDAVESFRDETVALKLDSMPSEIFEVSKDSSLASLTNENYYALVGAIEMRKYEQRFVGPDDKYFHDIIHKIHSKLSEFKIEGRIINILKGPVVDTFEWELGVGEKISKLTSAVEDLSLALLGAPIRMVYPMKGRGTVGIEVPRNPREIIFLDDILSSQEFQGTSHQLPLAMGKDAFGEPVVVDLASMPHMLVAGATGAGKSVFVNSILVSLLIKKSPAQMKLILIDPKQLELALYARLPHLIMPVITDAKTASISLLWAVEEMERRYSIMTEFGVRNIEGFNHKLRRAPPELIYSIRKFYEDENCDTMELPYIVIIVDEFADLILTQSGKDIEKNICRLAAKARASGIHLIVATQRPSVDVITGLIKSNFPTRVSFRVTSSVDSRTILNAMGAEKLLGKGDMLYKYGVDTTRIHSSYVEEEEIELIASKLGEISPQFNDSVLGFLANGGEDPDLDSGLSSKDIDPNGKDEKYDEAVRVVLEHRSASASLLQRRLGVGYNRAANLIEEMECNGVVGPSQGAKPRKVLLGASEM